MRPGAPRLTFVPLPNSAVLVPKHPRRKAKTFPVAHRPSMATFSLSPGKVVVGEVSESVIKQLEDEQRVRRSERERARVDVACGRDDAPVGGEDGADEREAEVAARGGDWSGRGARSADDATSGEARRGRRTEPDLTF